MQRRYAAPADTTDLYPGRVPLSTPLLYMEDWGTHVSGDRSSAGLAMERQLVWHTFVAYEKWRSNYQTEFPGAFPRDGLTLYALMHWVGTLDQDLDLQAKEHQQVVEERDRAKRELVALTQYKKDHEELHQQLMAHEARIRACEIQKVIDDHNQYPPTPQPEPRVPGFRCSTPQSITSPGVVTVQDPAAAGEINALKQQMQKLSETILKEEWTPPPI